MIFRLNFIFLLILNLTVMLLFPSNVFSSDIDSLGKIRGIKVNFENIFFNAYQNSTPPSSEIKLNVEKLLNDAGIKIFESDTTEYYLSGRPELYICANSKYDKSRKAILYFTEVSFIVSVKSPTNPNDVIRKPIISFMNSEPKLEYRDLVQTIYSFTKNIMAEICSYDGGKICAANELGTYIRL